MDVRGPFARLRAGEEAVRLGRNPDRPAAVTGGLGTVPASEVDTSARPPAGKQLTPREAERLMLAELMEAVRSLVTSSTELAGRLGGRRGAVNGVLAVRSLTVDTTGAWEYAGQVAIGSVLVDNGHASEVAYVVSGRQSGADAPTNGGVGVVVVPAGARRAVAVGDHGVTVFATAGTVLSVQVFAGLQAFGVGL